MDDGPPTDIVHESRSERDRPSGRRYPDTPMPQHFEDDADDEDTEEPNTSILGSSLKFVVAVLFITHMWIVWTMRTDMNIILQFLQEITQQNIHMTSVLHNQHQVKWQIVPTQS